MATGKAFSSVKRLAFSVLAVCIASCGFADKPFFFRHIDYGKRGALADNNFVNVNLYQYRGGREVGDDLTHYIGTGKYLVGRGQNRIDTWFYVPPADTGTWNIQQGYDDYMALSIDGAWVLINNTFTRSAEATIEMTEGWHACQIVYGDTYGGYGPNNFSPWSNEYPIGISINGGAHRLPACASARRLAAGQCSSCSPMDCTTTRVSPSTCGSADVILDLMTERSLHAQ